MLCIYGMEIEAHDDCLTHTEYGVHVIEFVDRDVSDIFPYPYPYLCPRARARARPNQAYYSSLLAAVALTQCTTCGQVSRRLTLQSQDHLLHLLLPMGISHMLPSGPAKVKRASHLLHRTRRAFGMFLYQRRRGKLRVRGEIESFWLLRP
jgi:hypothetical protein